MYWERIQLRHVLRCLKTLERGDRCLEILLTDGGVGGGLVGGGEGVDVGEDVD